MNNEEFEKVYNYSCKLLRLKDMSVNELIEKLYKKNFPQKIIFAVVEKLKKQKFLDDERFVKNYIEHQIAKGKNINLILKEITEKYKVSEEIIKKYNLENYKKNQLETITNIIRKKYQLNDKKRIYNFLLSKGYQDDEIEVIFDILREKFC